MAGQANTSGRPTLADERCYARTPYEEVAAAVGMNPGTGHSSQRAVELLGGGRSECAARGEVESRVAAVTDRPGDKSMSSLDPSPPAVVRVSRKESGELR